MKRVTPHFTLEEAACRDGTPYPAGWVAERLVPLFEAAEALRAALGGGPLEVMSCYRTPSHNRKVGGAPESLHLQGRAVDLRPADGAQQHWPALAAHALRELMDRGAIPVGGIGTYDTFVHYDTRGKRASWRGGVRRLP